MVSAESKIKCAAGTLRAYLRRRTDDAFASFVSSRSLALGGLGAQPQAYFGMGPPAGREARWGKEERRSVGGYPKRKRGDPTWSAARDDAYAQKERLRGERCLLCLCKRLRDADRREEIWYKGGSRCAGCGTIFFREGIPPAGGKTGPAGLRQFTECSLTGEGRHDKMKLYYLY